MVTTIWNSAIAMAGIAGGLLLDYAGAGAVPWAVFGLALVAFGIAFLGREYGFVSGLRS